MTLLINIYRLQVYNSVHVMYVLHCVYTTQSQFSFQPCLILRMNQKSEQRTIHRKGNSITF